VFRLRVLLSVVGYLLGGLSIGDTRGASVCWDIDLSICQNQIYAPIRRPPGSLLRSFSTECDAERSMGKDVISLKDAAEKFTNNRLITKVQL